MILFCLVLWVLPGASCWGSSRWIAPTVVAGGPALTPASCHAKREGRAEGAHPSFGWVWLAVLTAIPPHLQSKLHPSWKRWGQCLAPAGGARSPAADPACPYGQLAPLLRDASRGGPRWPVRRWLLLPRGFHQPVGLVILAGAFWAPPCLTFRPVFQDGGTRSCFVLASLAPLPLREWAACLAARRPPPPRQVRWYSCPNFSSVA